MVYEKKMDRDWKGENGDGSVNQKKKGVLKGVYLFFKKRRGV